jgi:hypothetical protein
MAMFNAPGINDFVTSGGSDREFKVINAVANPNLIQQPFDPATLSDVP